MSRVLVLYYSSYGHVETLAQAVAAGARSTGASVDIKRVPETAPLEIAKAANFKLDQPAPIARIKELVNYDAIIVGSPTRFGRLSSQMASFLDQAGGLWLRGAFNGKVGGAFTSTGGQHGGHEVTLFSIITNLLHFGMTIVGRPYGHQGQTTLAEIVGGSPYGSTTIAGARRQPQPSANELEGARHHGQLVAKTANRLFSS
jgi:NAD(P)H dehydrogenase (quinone)